MYKIEGGINFYKELLIEESNAQSSTSSSSDDCLLTNRPLECGYIELPCGHKFNFFPLYTEILYQKTNPAFVNNKYNTPVSNDKIKCPYCRTIHSNSLLPYIVNEKRINGINSPIKLCSLGNVKCQHVSVSTSKKKHTACTSFTNIHYIPDSHSGTGNAMFLCKRHVTQWKSKKNQNEIQDQQNEMKMK
jgi:hypothetical protein